MPVYDYKCQSHGLFHELATLAECAKPRPCPQCGQPGARVIVLAPEVLKRNSPAHKAAARNETAQHEPIVSNNASRAVSKADGGCGCSDQKKRSSQLLYTAQGEKFFPSQRPWMISH